MVVMLSNARHNMKNFFSELAYNMGIGSKWGWVLMVGGICALAYLIGYYIGWLIEL